MIGMSKVNEIRLLRKGGESVAAIARTVGAGRDTACKYVAADDLSPKPPVRVHRGSKLDPHRARIERWLDEEAENWRKQRYTAHRIWSRLRDELGVEVSEALVRKYVRALREERKAPPAEQYLDLEWAPGSAQADFGEADFVLCGVRVRLSFFVLSFPYSNVGVAQVFPGENAECVCQALRNIFEYLGRVPESIVFDNATGVGRRVCEEVRTTELFGAFAAHYCFGFALPRPALGQREGQRRAQGGLHPLEPLRADAPRGQPRRPRREAAGQVPGALGEGALAQGGRPGGRRSRRTASRWRASPPSRSARCAG